MSTKVRAPRGSLQLENKIEEILTRVKQPMSVTEISEVLRQDYGLAQEQSILRKNLYALVSAGKVSRRVETEQERVLRAGGRSPRGYNAMLYTIGRHVPARVATQIIDGYVLDADGNFASSRYNSQRRYKAAAAKTKKKYKVKARPAIAVKPVTDNTPGLVARFKALTDEIRDLKTRVRDLEKSNSMISDILKF